MLAILGLMLAIAVSWRTAKLNFIAEAQAPQAQPSPAPGPDKAWWEGDKDQLVTTIKTMQQCVTEAVARRRFAMIFSGVFACVALALAAVGIYGIMAYSVSRRAHEIGIRAALGAQSGDILKLVIWQGMKLALIGVAIGIVASLALTRLMRNLLFEVSAADPVTFVLIAALLSVVSLLACWLPARRATRVDPMVALRYE